MGFNSSRFSRMRSAFYSWKQKIDDEREESKRLAEEKAEQELEAAETARELAKKTASIASTTTYRNIVSNLKTDIEALVTKINTESTAISTLLTAQNSITTSSDMDTNLDSIITQNALIIKDFDTLVNKMSLIESAYESAGDASDDDYSETITLVNAASNDFNDAKTVYNTVLDAKADAAAAVTNTTKAYNTLLTNELQAARIAAQLAIDTAKVNDDLTALTNYSTSASGYETDITNAKNSAMTDFNTVDNATESTGLNTNLTSIIGYGNIVTEKLSLLSDVKATAEALYSSLLKTAGTETTLSDEITLASSKITAIRNNYNNCVSSKPTVDTWIANATAKINELRTSEAEAASEAAAAAAQAAAELKAAQAAADAQAAAEAQIAVLEDSMLGYNEMTTAPSGGNGTMWYHPTNGKLYQKQNNTWIQIAPGVGGMAIYDAAGTKVN